METQPESFRLILKHASDLLQDVVSLAGLASTTNEKLNDASQAVTAKMLNLVAMLSKASIDQANYIQELRVRERRSIKLIEGLRDCVLKQNEEMQKQRNFLEKVPEFATTSTATNTEDSISELEALQKQMVAEAKNFQEETKRIETLLRRVLTEKKQMEKALSKSNMMLQTQQILLDEYEEILSLRASGDKRPSNRPLPTISKKHSDRNSKHITMDDRSHVGDSMLGATSIGNSIFRDVDCNDSVDGGELYRGGSVSGDIGRNTKYDQVDIAIDKALPLKDRQDDDLRSGNSNGLPSFQKESKIVVIGPRHKLRYHESASDDDDCFPARKSTNMAETSNDDTAPQRMQHAISSQITLSDPIENHFDNCGSSEDRGPSSSSPLGWEVQNTDFLSNDTTDADAHQSVEVSNFIEGSSHLGDDQYSPIYASEEPPKEGHSQFSGRSLEEADMMMNTSSTSYLHSSASRSSQGGLEHSGMKDSGDSFALIAGYYDAYFADKKLSEEDECADGEYDTVSSRK